jgi:hypothetical protein
VATELAMYRGDDKTFPFTLTQNALPVDLTGAAITFSGRLATDFDGTDAAAFTLVEPTNITILPNQDTTGKGKITVTIPATVSVDLDTELYLCDIEVTDGTVWTWPEPIFGDSSLIRLRIKADVTHP